MIKVMIATLDGAQRRTLEGLMLQNKAVELSAVTDSSWELLELLGGQMPDVLLMGQELIDCSDLGVLAELRKTPLLCPEAVFAFAGKDTGKLRSVLDAMDRRPDDEVTPVAPVPTVCQAGGEDPMAYQRLIADFLFALGIPANVKGYRYLMWSLEQIRREPELLNLLTKALYPMVGRRFKTKDGAAERAMRNTISTAYERGDQRVWASYFPTSARGRKPTNGEFLAGANEALRLLAGKLYADGGTSRF